MSKFWILEHDSNSMSRIQIIELHSESESSIWIVELDSKKLDCWTWFKYWECFESLNLTQKEKKTTSIFWKIAFESLDFWIRFNDSNAILTFRERKNLLIKIWMMQFESPNLIQISRFGNLNLIKILEMLFKLLDLI